MRGRRLARFGVLLGMYGLLGTGAVLGLGIVIGIGGAIQLIDALVHAFSP